MEQTKTDIVIPVYKPGSEFGDLIKRLMHQTVVPEHIFIMQTIRDESEIMVQSMDERIRIIPVMQSEFDHGGTRALGMDKSTAEFVLMMTQDAVPADEHLIENLLAYMEDASVAVAYARQLARPNSGRVERMTRIYNYPAQSRVKSEDDKKELGVKTYFALMYVPCIVSRIMSRLADLCSQRFLMKICHSIYDDAGRISCCILRRGKSGAFS